MLGQAEVGEDHRLEAPFPQVPQSDKGYGHQPLKPGMVFGYHLYPYQDRLCLPGGDTGCLFQASDRLCRLHQSGYCSNTEGTEKGHSRAPLADRSIQAGSAKNPRPRAHCELLNLVRANTSPLTTLPASPGARLSRSQP